MAVSGCSCKIEMAVSGCSCEMRPEDLLTQSTTTLFKKGDQEDKETKQPRRAINDRRIQGPPNQQQDQKQLQIFCVVVTIAMSILAVIMLGALAAAGVAIYSSQQQFHTVYTRWGSSMCPPMEGTSTLYQGLMAGHHTKTSNEINDYDGGTNFQCLPLENVEYALPFQPGIQGNNTIYGAEYHTTINPESDLHNIPCAVCLVNSRTVTRMIPARTSCPLSWTREYYGYLMAQEHDYSTYECVDVGMEIVPGTVSQDSVAVLVHVEASCNGLPCNPYIEGKELNCVMCSI